jgi:hypothetical protein
MSVPFPACLTVDVSERSSFGLPELKAMLVRIPV